MKPTKMSVAALIWDLLPVMCRYCAHYNVLFLHNASCSCTDMCKINCMIYSVFIHPCCQTNKAVRQSSDLLFIETSFWFEESPCAVRTNTARLGRLCTLFVLSTLLVFEHMHAVLSSILVLVARW